MSVARITTVNFNTKDDADTMVENYVSNAPNEFPEAEQLLQVRTSDTTVVAISIYSDNEAMERASIVREKRLGATNHKHDSLDTKTGEILINHKK